MRDCQRTRGVLLPTPLQTEKSMSSRVPPACYALSQWAGTTERGWIPGLALLARNGGCVVFVIPAQAGIQFSAPGLRVAASGLARNDEPALHLSLAHVLSSSSPKRL